ncbi:hypothetical protein KY359_00895 [Candidatus Woesearchaeota archaeon]|nr:hypothetical protein [Candidatus Woesearchaeota archaeon]
MSRIKRHKLKKHLLNREEPKKSISKKALFTIIIGGLMVLSVFGIMFSSFNSGGEQAKYGEYTFQQTAQGWVTEIGGTNYAFNYLPSDIEDIEVDTSAVEKLKQSKVLYVTFNPNTRNVQKFELMRFELSNMLMNMAGKVIMPGISEENDGYNQPFVNCTNTTQTMPVVSIVEGNTTTAYLDGDCIILEADEYTTAALKDRVLYAMAGIIE